MSIIEAKGKCNVKVGLGDSKYTAITGNQEF